MTELKYLDVFGQRSTLRSFSKERHVSDSDLEAIISAASHAPTTGNMQLYSVVVTRDAAMKRRLAPLHFNQPTVEGCDVLLTVCADFNRFERWCECRDAVPGYRNFHSFVTALIDAVIFTQQFVTLAELNGIGSCYLGTATYSAAGISEILGLPDRVVPVATLAVGYPADGYPAPSDRLPASAIIHRERYHEYTDSDIDAAFGDKEALADSLRFVAENGKSTLAQVFTDVRYPRELNEAISRTFYEHISEKGFV